MATVMGAADMPTPDGRVTVTQLADTLAESLVGAWQSRVPVDMRAAAMREEQEAGSAEPLTSAAAAGVVAAEVVSTALAAAGGNLDRD
jgi:hypothetical protein